MKETASIELIKADLEERLKVISNRQEAIKSDRRQKKGPIPADWSEQATALENNEVLDQLDVSTRREISQIEAALTRINNGTYGVCTGCDDPINPRRLKALPFTSMCIECAGAK